MQTHDIYIGLGSNTGDRVAAMREAVGRLGKVMTLCKVSNLYVSAPLGRVSSDAFIHCAVHGKTNLAPFDVLDHLQAIELALGRQPGVQYGPRQIDLDILLYDTITLDNPLLKIPHPDLAKRAYVLKSLAEIAPALVHPLLYYTISQLLLDADDVHHVRRYDPSTEAVSS